MPDTKPSNVKFTLTQVLLVLILLALAVLITVVIVKPADRQGRGNSSGGRDGDNQAVLGDGKSAKRDIEKFDPPKPSQPVDTSRIRQTYTPGKQYRSVLKAQLTGTASSKDWGVEVSENFHYVASAEIVRTIESNDGTTLVFTQEVRQARTLAAFTQFSGLNIDLPLGVFVILDTSSNLTPGTSYLLQSGANELFQNEVVRGFLERMTKSEDTKAKLMVDSLEGKRVRVVYKNGVGVEDVIPVACTLTQDQVDFFAATAPISDAYILPDENSKVGDSWTIHGQDMVAMLDPSLRATPSGKLTARRVKDMGTKDAPVAVIQLESGVLNLLDIRARETVMARWSPQGELRYSFKPGIVTSANLSGDFVVEKRSTDHILFEARQTTQPQYNIRYDAEEVRD
jgi:preprotein translocase subunit SecG